MAGQALGKSDYNTFCEKLEVCLENQDELNDSETRFVSDMDSNHDKYGEKVFCSDAQLNWLKQIAERFEV